MSIYEEPKDYEKYIKIGKKVLPIIAIIIVIGIVLWGASETFKPFPFTTALSKNPIYNVENTYTILTLNITNITPKDAEIVSVNVYPKDSKSIHVFPQIRTITTLGKDEQRTIWFRLQPNPQNDSKKIVPGKYGIDVEIKIDFEVYKKTIYLEVIEKN